MKNIFLLLISFISSFALFAQETNAFLRTTLVHEELCIGEQVCTVVELSTSTPALPLSDIALTFSWDNSIYSFVEARPFFPEEGNILPNVDNDNFTNTASSLTFTWNQTPPFRMTRSVPTTFFEFCLEIKETPNKSEYITLDAKAIRGETEVYGILEFIKPILSIDSEIVIPYRTISLQDEQICMPVSLNGLTRLQETGFTLAWDKNLLAFNSIDLDNSEFDGLTLNDFSIIPDEGKIGVEWTAFKEEGIGFTPRSGRNYATSLMYNICFDVVATAATSTQLLLIPNSPEFPAYFNIPCHEEDFVLEQHASQINGTIHILEEAYSIAFPDSTISSNTDYVCVPLQANNFRSLIGMQLEVLWDKDILEFDRLKLDESELPDLRENNFNPDFSESIKMSWIENNLAPITLDEDDIIFELCFNVIGEEGDEAIIKLTTQSGLPLEIIDEEFGIVPILNFPGIVRIRGEERFILPGDANEDKQADHFDLLHIGLGYSATGTERANNNILWEHKYSRNWEGVSPVSLVNYKHSDTNGDSQVDMDDVEAIVQNWGKTEDIEGNLHEPDSYISETNLSIEESTVNLGQNILELPILLGTPDMPTEQAYGIAFSISYDYDGDMPAADWINVEVQNSWLGTLGEDLIAIQRHFPEEQRLDLALTRLDGTSRDGSGQIAQLSIVVEDVLLLINQPQDKSKMMNFSIHNIRLINEREEAIEVQDSQIDIEMDMSTGVYTLASSAITVFPSITNDRLHLQSDETIEQAIILNLDGKQVDLIEHPQTTLDVTALDNGMYLLQLITETGISVKRFKVVK